MGLMVVLRGTPWSIETRRFVQLSDRYTIHFIPFFSLSALFTVFHVLLVMRESPVVDCLLHNFSR